MANKVVIFPAGKQAEAEAYLAWVNDAARNPFAPDVFGYLRLDAFDQHVVPYLGPPFTWNGADFPEPEGGPAARADGVLHDSAVWPVVEE